MKKYTIIRNYTAVAPVEVLAETREEALEKACRDGLDPADCNFELDSAEIGHEEEVPELGDLVRQAESVVREAYEDDADIVLDPWPRVSLEVWDGERIQYRTDLMEQLYWDEDCNGIGFSTADCDGDRLLDELPELEQLNICRSIIAQAGRN